MRDRDVRAVLLSSLNAQYQHTRDTVIVEELGLQGGEARVDATVVNGCLHGYEIKSAKDTLDRLPTQVAIYNSVLETVTLLAATNHLEEAESLVPPWWGLVEAHNQDGVVDLRVVRSAKVNPKIEKYALAQLLWRDEALSVLERNQLDHGVRNQPRRVLWQRLADELSVVEISAAVRFYLRHRQGWRSGSPQRSNGGSYLRAAR